VTPSFLIDGKDESYDFLSKSEDVLKNERLFFYRIVALCSGALHLSYLSGESGDGIGSAHSKSPFIDDVKILIEGAGGNESIEDRAPDINTGACSQDDILREFFLSMNDKSDDGKRSTFNFLLSQPDKNELFKRIFTNTVIEHDRENPDLLTSYEGNILCDSGDDYFRERLMELVETRTFSASQLDMFASCPIGYFFGKVLYLSPIELPEVGIMARDKGTILHDILFRYFAHTNIALKLADLPDESQAEELINNECKVIEKVANEYFGENSDLLANLNAQMLAIEKQNVFDVLFSVVRYEIEGKYKAAEKLKVAEDKYEDAIRKSEKSRLKGVTPKYVGEAERRLLKAKRDPFMFEPKYFEYGFGTRKSSGGTQTSGEHGMSDTTEVSIKLTHEGDPEQVSILIRGFIDRIDVNRDTGEFIIIDYKSGTPPNAKNVKKGCNLQLPLYEEVVQNTLLKGQTPACSVYYALKDTGRKKKEIHVRFDEIREKLLGYIKMMQAGEFNINDDTRCKSFCDFPTICRGKVER